ncbi:peroxisome proliferator-activated receptor gamma coactivator-related protein 1 [Hoplias malabaricus]|uniref:peroxisome proliferator-activated receptor gamma coactivator-related protein 1 n=1 Tax=Hoplias malabaricus TaxID=27720 RepID=UPI003462D5E2
MAARWGTGEELLNACNMEYFSTASLDEVEILQDELCGLQHHGLITGDTLDAQQPCLDPSILSMFEHSSNGEVTFGVDEESEATLLSALTDILDNVDEENLSPFDILPDAELLQGQKGHDNASLKKLLSLSCSPPKKELKHFPEKICDYEEVGEEGSFSTLINELSVASMDEQDLCLPIFLEHDGESVPVTLGELFKHMHPYSMTVCMEGEEQLLPEGGIVLEVVDKGENGEPILAIPDMRSPFSLPSRELELKQELPENSKPSLKPEVLPEEGLMSKVKDKKVDNVVIKPSKKEFSKKCQAKKKKKRNHEVQFAEGRILRSASSKKAAEVVKEVQEEQKKKKKVTFAPVLIKAEAETGKADNLSEVKSTEAYEAKSCISSVSITTTTREACAEVIEPKPLPVLEENQTPVALPLGESGEIDVVSKEEPAVCPPIEPKPKSLSLQQYRLLRQHKKPLPPEMTKDNSTKWPLLPETPKELPPIPCLPDPNPRDPCCAVATSAKMEPAPEIMPAWQPRGPTAPPTPQALLVPPASMLAGSKKLVPPRSVPPPALKPEENSATSTSPSIQPNPQNPPSSTGEPQNTIVCKVSLAAKESPLEMPASQPAATTNGVFQSIYAPGQTNCLQDKPSPSDQVIKVIPSALQAKVKALSKPQDMTENTTRTTTIVPSLNAVPNQTSAAVPVKRVAVEASVPIPAKPTLPVNTSRPTLGSQRHVAPIAAQPFTSAPIQARIVKLAVQMRLASAPVPKAKSPTAELIESFTSEIGIEASDLTSLLEQFEETQPKEDESLPEVCGRAAAVGNSSGEKQADTMTLRKASSPDLGSTAGLTPPATPPHQMWKPLAPVALLGKSKKSEVPKPTPNKAIHIEPLPLSSGKLPSRPQTSVTLGQTQPFSLDHDYCLLPKEASQNELGNRWNIKHQSSIVIKYPELPSNQMKPQKGDTKLAPTPVAAGSTQKNLKPVQNPLCESQSDREPMTSTIMVTPDASPDRMDSEYSLQDDGNKHQRFPGYSERSPSPYHRKRGRSQRTYRTRLRSSSGSTSSSSESSRSPSPSRKRYRSGNYHRSSRSPPRYNSRSRSSSRSISPSRRRRNSYSSSCSGSWRDSHSRSLSRSQSRSRSPSPSHRPRHWKTHLNTAKRSSYCYDSRDHNEEVRRRKDKAIEERRVVYVGRINGSMTRKELKERFSYFGEIEDCTVHFRERGDNYGFVTYYDTKDAFTAIENGSKLRQPNELPFDLCFGGRRQFCRSSYADLDSNQEYESAPAKGKFDALDFDTLLKQAQRNLKR